MEGLTPKSKTIAEWLGNNQPTKDKQVVFDFAIFYGKIPKEIVDEFNDSLKKQFADYYVKQRLKYTAQWHKMLPSNSVRAQVNIIRSFLNITS